MVLLAIRKVSSLIAKGLYAGVLIGRLSVRGGHGRGTARPVARLIVGCPAYATGVTNHARVL